jgi:hypothetical protein
MTSKTTLGVPTVALAAALCTLAFLGACSGTQRALEARPTIALPEWIVKVEPEPGQETSAVRRVEVHYEVATGGENVRLSIDGTDVTAYADFGREENVGGPGTLVYDFEQGRDFVPIDPGEHTATVSRVRLTGIGEQFEVLDSFSWTFTIQ